MEPEHWVTAKLQAATDQHRQGRLAEAEVLYREILAAEPQDFHALNRLGILKYQQGQLDAAHDLLVEAVARNPQSDRALSNLATVLLARKDLTAALAACQKALALRPDEPDIHFNRAHILMELKRYEDALAGYDRALELRPDDAQALAARGKALMLLDRPLEAATSFASVLEKSPGDADMWVNYASVLIAVNRYEDAIPGFQRALELRPDYGPALMGLGKAQLALKRFEEAAACYDSLLARAPDSLEALGSRGMALLNLGRAADALVTFDRALTLSPNDPAALFGRGCALDRLGRTGDALASVDRLLERYPRHAGVLRTRMKLLCDVSRFDEALACSDRLLDLDSKDASALVARASILLELRRPGEALLFLEQALEARPDDMDAVFALGNAMAALNRCEEALAHYDRVLAVSPGHVTCLNNRGNALCSLDRCQEALSSYDLALAIDPDRLDTLYNRANVLAAMQNGADAMAAYERVLAMEPRHLPARWALVMGRIPVGATTRSQMDAGRSRFAAGLEELAQHIPDGLAGEQAVCQMVPFYLAYDERNNRELFARYGALCVEAVAKTRKPLAFPKKAVSRLRLGIVSAHVRRHSVWNAILKGIVENLDSTRFELDIFHLGALTDAETDWARSSCVHFDQGPHAPELWPDRILARQPDVLVYPEIGMDLSTIHLASQRLAPLQAAMWGHPHTTGLPTIDWFISATAFEPPDAQEHYTERLVCLPRLGCKFAPSGVEAAAVDLETLGIDPNAPLLLSPGTPYKYAAEHDWVFPAIAHRLGKCTIAFFVNKSAPWSRVYDSIVSRLEGAFAGYGLRFNDHCVVLPWQELGAYFGLMLQADVMLDTIGFSGFNTAMQAVECGLPIVTREGKYMRGRLASGVLHVLGLGELVASDEQRYVELAVALASDRTRRAKASQRIEQRRHTLYCDVETVLAFQDCLLEWIRS